MAILFALTPLHAQRTLSVASATPPNMRVLYMSGYSADTIAHRGILDEGVHFLSKPASVDALAQAIRQCLHGE